MNLNVDLHHVYALERQQRLRAEAAAHRVVKAPSARTARSALRGQLGRLATGLTRRRVRAAVTDNC
jgi:hypothetical protein